jgi:hypothetical protein
MVCATVARTWVGSIENKCDIPVFGLKAAGIA